MKYTLQKLSFRNKILTILLFITVLFSIFALILVHSIGKVSDVTSEIKDDNIPEIVWLTYWEKELDIKEYMVTSYMRNDFQNGFMEVYEKNELESNKEMVEKYGEVPESVERFERDINLLDFTILGKVQGMLKFDNIATTKKVIDEEYIPKLQSLREDIIDSKQFEYVLLEENTNRFPQIIEQSLWYLFILLIGAIILSIVTSYRISSSLTKPLDQMVNKVNTIANGHYGLTLKQTKQIELQHLTKSINTMSVSLEESFNKIWTDKLKTEQILNSLPVGIITFEANNEYYVNSSARNLLQLNTPDFDLDQVGTEKENKEFWNILKDGVICHNKKIDYVRNGTVYHFMVSQTKMNNLENVKIGQIFYFIDITELEIITKRMHQSEKLALVGEMAAVSAHEIRNPLSVIYGFISLMNKSLLDEDRNKFHIPLLMKEIERLNAIVEEMLLMAKPSPPDISSVEVSRVIDEILPLINNSSRIRFEVKVDSASVLADAKQMKQVLLNLLRNSVDAIKDEGEISVTSIIKGDRYQLYIKDNGKGIPDYIQAKMFEPFSSSKNNGTGLGLNIVQRIMEAHNGSIELVTTSSEGTEFLIELPLE
ncbi:ATP-binding protein [Aquibacillus koreensis]|uniref:histidine kinase n=1 Tax=Aquibacillus koreensis TaxID=279446 RepID=A0A9X3WKE9_9BACI|nr:ATP-binding protein [Aquibacillus koreensis]MCT2537478.1 ATP-binding protein [Aquibacillus koreensis]MDC3418924.1 ATP-binding protein [Aquibacillus koreensis]